MEFVFVSIFSLSIFANIWIFLAFKRAHKKPAPTYGAQELLAAITSGPAVLKIEVINIEDIILRSPRGAK